MGSSFAKTLTYESDVTLNKVSAYSEDVEIFSKNLTFDRGQPFEVYDHTVSLKVDGDLTFVNKSLKGDRKIGTNGVVDIEAKNIIFKDSSWPAFSFSKDKESYGGTVNLKADKIIATGDEKIIEAMDSHGVHVNLEGNLQIEKNGVVFRFDGEMPEGAPASELNIKYAGASELVRVSNEPGKAKPLMRAGKNTTIRIEPKDENSSLNLQGEIGVYEEKHDVFVNLGKKGSWIGGVTGRGAVKVDLGNEGNLSITDGPSGKLVITGGTGTITSGTYRVMSSDTVVDMQKNEGVDIRLIPRKQPRLLVVAYRNVPDSADIGIDLSQWGEVDEGVEIPVAYFEGNMSKLLDGKIVEEPEEYTNFYQDLKTVKRTDKKKDGNPELNLFVVSLQKNKATPLIKRSADFGEGVLSSLLISNSQIPFSLEHGLGLWVDYGYRTYKYNGVKSHQNVFGIGYSKEINHQEGMQQVGFGVHFSKSKDRKLHDLRSNNYFISIYDDVTLKDRHHINLMAYGGFLRRDADTVGHFNNKAFGLTARYGCDLNAMPDLVITPAVGFYYQHMDRTRFQRDTVSYEVGAKDLFVASVGADVKWLGSSMFKPYMNVAYYLPNSQSADIHFSDGVTTLTASSEKIKSWGRVKIGGTYQLAHNLSLTGDLGTDFGKKRSKAFNSNLAINYIF